MFDKAVQEILSNLFKTKYSYLLYPPSHYAIVTRVNSDSYNVKIIDKNGEQKENFPIIPNVKSDLTLTVGQRVVIILVSGNINDVYIVGTVTV